MFFEQPKQKKLHKYLRTVLLGLLVLAVMFSFSVRLAALQIQKYDEYRADAAYQAARTAKIKAARGEIFDRYGRPIAVNRDGYDIVFDAAYLSTAKLNRTIEKLYTLLSANKDEWRDKLPISQTIPYQFEDDETAVAALKKKLNLNHYATAQNCYDAMVEKYGLTSYSSQKQRMIMGVRYTMDAEDFSVSLPYTFAQDVSDDTRAKIMEASVELKGVTIEEVPVREYVDPDMAAHLIGAIGPIYAEDWEELKAEGYSYNDYVGKSGVEAAFEKYLRGTDGVKKILTDANGNTTTVVDTPAIAGNTVMLTIDSKLQKVAQESLKKLILNMQKGEAKNANAGAVVVYDVKNGGILAAANYPTYDMETYKKDYDLLLKDPAKPLFDRAFNGNYQPGSTFKPGIAAIGLQRGVVSADEIINCTQYYPISGMTFHCMHYHGGLNVVSALSKSCNYYFYETGNRLGIDVMNQYCKLFGLGVKTGVEVSESSGILAGPAYRKTMNAPWYPGDTVQAAIGQSDNLFTPLQLATYTGTIASNGIRYQTHLLHQVKTYNLEKTIVETPAVVAADTGISKSVFSTVKQGMLSAALEGTASSVFGNYDIQVGGKTGTAQNTGEDHGVFISFAPYENTEIAVAIIVEHGLHGYTCAPVVKDIYDAYFFSEPDKYEQQAIGELLP